MYHIIEKFEKNLACFTGAPYVIATDCCTHAIELCMRFDKIKKIDSVTCYTYLSVPMVLVKLGIKFSYNDERWIGEYQFKGTRIWDSARLLHPRMHRKGQLQCVSFGNGKPLLQTNVFPQPSFVTPLLPGCLPLFCSTAVLATRPFSETLQSVFSGLIR